MEKEGKVALRDMAAARDCNCPQISHMFCAGWSASHVMPGKKSRLMVVAPFAFGQEIFLQVRAADAETVRRVAF
jgi:hypothetical protein